MTPRAAAFVAVLNALCVAYQYDLIIDVEYDGPKFVLVPLAPGEEPLRSAVWEDETTGPSCKQE